MNSKTNSIGLALVLAGLTVLTGCKEEPEAGSLPLLAATNAEEITVSSAVVIGVVLTHGSAAVTARGFCWSTNSDPSVDDNKLSVMGGIGQFAGRITGLLPGTDYYVSSWAANAEGTSYGIPYKIRTPLTATPAALETLPPEYLSATGAVSGGDITDIGNGEVTERGICWNTEPSPTIGNTKTAAPASLLGSGRFTIKLTGLKPGSTYFLRAYAINNAGVSYGPEISFKTPASLGIRRAEFPGETQNHSVTFSIGNKIYIGLGFAGGGGGFDWPVNDFWEWDQTTNQWKMLEQFPGTNYDAIGFAIGGKGYVFTSGWYNSETGYAPNELWEYDPGTNSWTKKSNFPSGGFRIYPAAFTIGSKLYIGLGLGVNTEGEAEFLTDLWEWNQETDVWTSKADLPGRGRSAAAAFSIGNRGYVGTGSYSTDLLADFWEYDQNADRWSRKADFSGIARTNALGFSVGNKGYLGAGYHSNGLGEEISQDFWEYDQALDRWDLFGSVATEGQAWAGGVVEGNGYFLVTLTYDEYQAVELWTFPMTSEK